MCHGQIDSNHNPHGRGSESTSRNESHAVRGPSAEVADRLAADKRWKEAEAAAVIGRKTMSDRLNEFTKRGVAV